MSAPVSRGEVVVMDLGGLSVVIAVSAAAGLMTYFIGWLDQRITTWLAGQKSGMVSGPCREQEPGRARKPRPGRRALLSPASASLGRSGAHSYARHNASAAILPSSFASSSASVSLPTGTFRRTHTSDLSAPTGVVRFLSPCASTMSHIVDALGRLHPALRGGSLGQPHRSTHLHRGSRRSPIFHRRRVTHGN